MVLLIQANDYVDVYLNANDYAQIITVGIYADSSGLYTTFSGCFSCLIREQ